MQTRRFLKAVAVAALFISFTSCSPKKEQTEDTMENTEMNAENVKYTCTMHPEVISDKPGKCPKCGMELVKKEDGATDTTAHGTHTE
jgi:hypothetical protein